MPLMAPAGPRTSDAALVAAFRAGDRHAFELIHERYRPRLERFAQRILQRSAPGVAEDVVQEAMLRASRALVRDDRPMDLKPWLFRLVRNCALDELGRVRMDSVPLDDELMPVVLAAPPGSEPEYAADRRAGVRDLLDDLATLPDEQRHALVRRELDGLSHEQVAAELGLTTQATKSLVFRARANLIRHRAARSADCEGVRARLLEAADEHRRAPAGALRHVAVCAPCRAFRHELKLSGQALAILNPGLLLAGLGGAGGAIYGFAGKGAAVKAGVAATAGIAAVGVVIAGTQVFGPGDPSPQSVRSPAVPRGVLAAQQPVPAGTSIVRRQLVLPAGSAPLGGVRITCPAPMRVADLLPVVGSVPLRTAYARGTVVGASRSARVLLRAPARPAQVGVTIGILCRRPAAGGSIRAADQRSSAAPTAQVAVREALLRVHAGGAATGSVRLGQPVRVLRRSGDWSHVSTDAGRSGWVRSSALRTLPERTP